MWDFKVGKKEVLNYQAVVKGLRVAQPLLRISWLVKYQVHFRRPSVLVIVWMKKSSRMRR